MGIFVALGAGQKGNAATVMFIYQVGYGLASAGPVLNRHTWNI
jgi:hypothetical protein